MNNVREGCVLIYIAVLSFVTAQRSPTITYISEDQVVDVGRSVELQCSVQYGTEFSVIWLKAGNSYRDRVILSNDAALVVKDSRFTLLFDGAASTTYAVLIKDVQETDAGIYQCEVVMSVNNKISAEVHLSVRRPPVITDNSTQAIVTSEGKSVDMECFATGFPTPKIVWRRENNALLPTAMSHKIAWSFFPIKKVHWNREECECGSVYNGNILKIQKINKEDRGTYYCFADNGVGKGDRRNVNLEIEFAPKVIVPRPKLEQALHYDVDLECQVEAYPTPQIIWVKDEFLLSNSKKYHFSMFVTADEFTDSTLRIVTLEKEQYGSYKCKAVNKLGSDEGEIHLHESKNPVCPPACGQSHYNSAETFHSSLRRKIVVTAFISMNAIFQHLF